MRPPADRRWHDRDAAHRMRDGLGLHAVALSTEELLAGRWVVIRLSDGHVDPTAYESRAEAMRFAPGLESLYVYFKLPLERLSAEVCDVLLWYARTAYANGYRPDPTNPDTGYMLPNGVIL